MVASTPNPRLTRAFLFWLEEGRRLRCTLAEHPDSDEGWFWALRIKVIDHLVRRYDRRVGDPSVDDEPCGPTGLADGPDAAPEPRPRRDYPIAEPMALDAVREEQQTTLARIARVAEPVRDDNLDRATRERTRTYRRTQPHPLSPRALAGVSAIVILGAVAMCAMSALGVKMMALGESLAIRQSGFFMVVIGLLFAPVSAVGGAVAAINLLRLCRRTIRSTHRRSGWGGYR